MTFGEAVAPSGAAFSVVSGLSQRAPESHDRAIALSVRPEKEPVL